MNSWTRKKSHRILLPIVLNRVVAEQIASLHRCDKSERIRKKLNANLNRSWCSTRERKNRRPAWTFKKVLDQSLAKLRITWRHNKNDGDTINLTIVPWIESHVLWLFMFILLFGIAMRRESAHLQTDILFNFRSLHYIWWENMHVNIEHRPMWSGKKELNIRRCTTSEERETKTRDWETCSMIIIIQWYLNAWTPKCVLLISY